MKSGLFLFFLVISYLFSPLAWTQNTLIPPIILENEERLAGNPLPTYLKMLQLAEEYEKSSLKQIYQEQRYNLEQFLGIHTSALNAMNLLSIRQNLHLADTLMLLDYEPVSFLETLIKASGNHNIIIYGEEHHLPQTRSIYTDMLQILYDSGFRYLAAETFTDTFEKSQDTVVKIEHGYYLQDPIFAEAVENALEMGFTLVAYDTKAHNRDSLQAANIYNDIFSKDPDARVLIIAGRSHASEIQSNDGWKPMAWYLKQLTGLDPFTIYAPTMTERLTREQEHPVYRQVIKKFQPEIPVVLTSKTDNSSYGSAAFDAYLFFPRTKEVCGRPDWLMNDSNRVNIKIPKGLKTIRYPYLIQAFEANEPFSAVPFDQILVQDKNSDPCLILKEGTYKFRSVEHTGENITSREMIINIPNR